MTETKVVIIDDEMPARNLLRQYLQNFSFLNIIAECKNGIEAVGVINALQPDLIFLDIQMPGKTGFEVLQEIEFFPKIIFSTAYDKYALQAFEVNAIDYLLKPYTKDRLEQSLQKALSAESSMLKNLQRLTESLQNKVYPERILVEQGTKLVSLSVHEILWVEADGDYTKIHTIKQSYLSNKGISELEIRLNPQQFQRVHRSAIISLSAIKEIHKDAAGPQITLLGGTVVKVSRGYSEAFKKLIY
ncbi:MAG TPA: LytTR family DNA-binding domain-containing protein [Segetibacter sp.]|jgi:two-component system LytT family response regulator